jgi:UDP-N-acetylglucosamine diphosphorylase/glucosamine-1-phosphate N-acetyltransferase
MLEPAHHADCAWESIDACLEQWKSSLPQVPAAGSLIRHGWDLIELNSEQLCRDVARFEPCSFNTNAAIVGPRERLYLDAAARVEPMVLLDTTRGPIRIERDATVMAFSRLEGPCYVGPRSQVKGGSLRGGVTLGPDCRIGGEVEASIIHGHSNKAHDGFLGHSYVGEWVNLGAGTQNSDLRNDYGEVSVTIAGRRVPTGMTKAGCLIGDHTKSGLGALVNTGANIGAFCNLLPGGLLPRYMPSFCSWWNAALAANDDFPALLETARTIMARRDVTLTAAHEKLYRHLFEQLAGEQRRVLREAEMRRLRRSA